MLNKNRTVTSLKEDFERIGLLKESKEMSAPASSKIDVVESQQLTEGAEPTETPTEGELTERLAVQRLKRRPASARAKSRLSYRKKKAKIRRKRKIRSRKSVVKRKMKRLKALKRGRSAGIRRRFRLATGLEQFANLIEQLQNSQITLAEGVDNTEMIMKALESIEKMSMGQNEIGWEKSEKVVRARILSGFGVHPFVMGEEVPGSYAQMAIVQERFYRRVNVFLSMLGDALTIFVPKFFNKDQKKNRKDKIVVWWDPCRATDPSMEKSLWEGARGRDDVSSNEFRAYMDLPPEEDKDAAVINKANLTQVVQVAAQTTQGMLKPEQAVAILAGIGIPEDVAKKIAGEGAPEPEPEPTFGTEEDFQDQEDEEGTEEQWAAELSSLPAGSD
jgi:hypothetical protein